MINITVKNLSLTIENKLIFSGINAVFSSGNIYVIKGINGSGKTSLLRCICGVIPKHFDGNIQGSIEMLTTINYGYLMQEPEMQICFVFIEEELFFAAENTQKDIGFSMKIYDELLRDFPFLLLNKETNSLSFAEKKIMLFCGIIIKECQVLLLDEPLAGLSIEYRKKVIDIILQQKKSGKIIIIAEHNNDFDDIADEVICL